MFGAVASLNQTGEILVGELMSAGYLCHSPNEQRRAADPCLAADHQSFYVILFLCSVFLLWIYTGFW